MLEKLCFLRAKVPRPLPPDIIASVKMFLETLPQFEEADRTLVLDREKGTRIFPSEELAEQVWFATLTEPRWPNLPAAEDWAYGILENSRVDRMVTTLRYLVTADWQMKKDYFFYQYMHFYHATHQDIRGGTGNIVPGYTPQTPAITVQREEIRTILEIYRTIDTPSSALLLWGGSFLEMADRFPEELHSLLSQVGQHPAFVAYSNNGANHFSQIAQAFLEMSLPHYVTDAELLNDMVPWGGRTRLFCHEAPGATAALRFSFCYIKPLREYPPIRLEIPDIIPREEIDSLLDRVLGHIILNPNIF